MLPQVQKYVDHVRTLSEERDKLTIEFERENEKLKMELENLHKRAGKPLLQATYIIMYTAAI